MAISELHRDQAVESMSITTRLRATGLFFTPVAMMALAFLPMLSIQAHLLWNRPHYQFFPVVLLGGLILAYSATRRLGVLHPGPRRRSLVQLGLAWTTLALAGLLASPWLAEVALMATLAAAAFDLGGRRLLGALMPAWVFLALAVPPPLGLDWTGIGLLQSVVTSCSSPVLDTLRVTHLVEGNVLQIAGQRLFVEQACSGVQSLLVVVACVLFFLFWVGRPLTRAVGLLLVAVAWVVVGNLARVVTVAYVADRWHLDLASGWRHEALGGAVFALTLGLIASTDRLFQFMTAMVQSLPYLLHWRRRPALPPEISPQPEPEPVLPTVFPDLARTCLSSWRVAMAFVSLGLVQLIWFCPTMAEAFRPDADVVRILQDLGTDDLPERWGSFERLSFGVEHRGAGNSIGEFSRTWRYRAGRHTAIVSVDFPFTDWHELTLCYKAQGWSVRGRQDSGAAVVEARMEQAPYRYATLIFGLLDRRGDPVAAVSPVDGLAGLLAERMRILRMPLARDGRGRIPLSGSHSHQVQILLEGEVPPTPEEEAQARAFFEAVRDTIRRRVAGSGRAS